MNNIVANLPKSQMNMPKFSDRVNIPPHNNNLVNNIQFEPTNQNYRAQNTQKINDLLKLLNTAPNSYNKSQTDLLNMIMNKDPKREELMFNENKKKMTKAEYLQDIAYQNFAKPLLPIITENIRNARNNFEEAKKNKNAMLLNLNQIKNPSLKYALLKIGTKNDSKGIFYSYNSEQAKAIGNSKEIKDYISNNYNKLKNNGIQVDSLEFKPSFKIENADLHYAYQHITLYNPHIDENNYFSAFILDYLDFEKRNPNDLRNLPNNWGYSMQLKYQLENCFYLIYIYQKV